MSIFKLKDLVEKPISGEWGEEILTGDGISVIRTTNFTNTGRIDYAYLAKRFIPISKIEAKQLQENDIIIEKSGGGPKTPVGRVVFFDILSSEPFLCNNFTAILRPKSGIVNPKFLHYQFLYLYQIGKVKQYQTQTIGIYNLNLDRYLCEEVDVPDLFTQSKLVAYLNMIQGLIDNRIRMIQFMDVYLRSIFFEMFGDPVLDNQGVGKKPLSFFGHWRSGGTPPRIQPAFYGGDIPWFTSGELNDIFIKDSNEKITEEAIKETSAQRVEKGSLLIGMYDTAALKTAITLVDSSCNQAIAFAKLDEDICEPVFIYYCIIFSREYYLTQRKGARQKNLNLKILKSIEVLYPSKNLQMKFVEKFRRIRAIKQLQENSLQSLKTLFQLSLHNAFNKFVPINEEEVFESILQDLGIDDLKKEGRLQYLLNWLNSEQHHFSTFENYNFAWDRLRDLLEDGCIKQVLENDEIKLIVKK